MLLTTALQKPTAVRVFAAAAHDNNVTTRRCSSKPYSTRRMKWPAFPQYLSAKSPTSPPHPSLPPDVLCSQLLPLSLPHCCSRHGPLLLQRSPLPPPLYTPPGASAAAASTHPSQSRPTAAFSSGTTLHASQLQLGQETASTASICSVLHTHALARTDPVRPTALRRGARRSHSSSK